MKREKPYLKPALMKVRITHIAKIPKQIGAHMKHNIPQRTLFSPMPELSELVPYQLLIIKISFVHLGCLLLKHFGCMAPFLIGQ